MRPSRLLPLLPALLLAACGGSEPVRSTPRPAPPPARPGKIPPTRPPVTRPAPPRAQVLALPGLEGVIGSSGDDLVGRFGQPRLDVLEGDARKLQFVGPPCVLDIYLYPAAPGREPQATYVDARRPSDGKDVDRAACVAALRKR